jgi:hypothetical protein
LGMEWNVIIPTVTPSIIFRAEPWWNHQAAEIAPKSDFSPADAKADQRLPPLEAMEFCWEFTGDRSFYHRFWWEKISA